MDLKKYGVDSWNLIYDNPLASETDIKDFVLEGSAVASFPRGVSVWKMPSARRKGRRPIMCCGVPRISLRMCISSGIFGR